MVSIILVDGSTTAKLLLKFEADIKPISVTLPLNGEKSNTGLPLFPPNIGASIKSTFSSLRIGLF